MVDVIQREHAQALSVATAGELVALHCHTASGTIVVTVPLVVFQAAARGERDGNGRPWPAARRSSIEVLEADAEETRPASNPHLVRKPHECGFEAGAPAYTPPTATGKITRARMTPERQQRIDEAALRIIATGEKAVAVAAEIGEPINYIYSALGRLRTQSRPPVPKPSGKLL